MQKTDAIFSKVLGKQANKVTEDGEDDKCEVRPVIPYEGKKWFEVPGLENVYDFTRLPLDFMTYDEDVVRYNINKVKRPLNIHVVAPSKQKVKIFEEPVNHVERNKDGLTEVSAINKKRAMIVQQQRSMTSSRASTKTKASSQFDKSTCGQLTPRSLRLKTVSPIGRYSGRKAEDSLVK